MYATILACYVSISNNNKTRIWRKTHRACDVTFYSRCYDATSCLHSKICFCWSQISWALYIAPLTSNQCWNATTWSRKLIVSLVCVQSQRPEAREPAPGWEEQHPYRWLWHGLPTGGRQPVRDQLWVSTCAPSVCLNHLYKQRFWPCISGNCNINLYILNNAKFLTTNNKKLLPQKPKKVVLKQLL